MVSDKEAKCSICKEIKNIDQFRSNKGQWAGRKFRLSFCTTCRNKRRNAQLKSNPLSMLKAKLQGVRQRCKQKKIPCDITAQYLYDMYIEQKGKCFYSDSEMFLGNDMCKRQTSLSVDRVDPNKGYTMGNIVLCTDRMNSIKNNLNLDELKFFIPRMFNRLKKKGFIHSQK